MASTKQEAINQLGTLESWLGDTYNKQRSSALGTYNTAKSSIESNYQDLLKKIEENTRETKGDFASGRNTIRENAFLNNRNSLSDLSARGVGLGGLNQLTKVGNRMEEGQQYSNAANTFYDAMNDIASTKATGEKTYGTDLETATNTYNSLLADIGASESAVKNSYAQAVAQLAEQIAARRQSASDAAKARKQYTDSLNAEAKYTLDTRLKTTAGKKVTQKSYIDTVAEYINLMGGSSSSTVSDATKYLKSIGIYAPSPEPVTIGNYVSGKSTKAMDQTLNSALLNLGKKAVVKAVKPTTDQSVKWQ